MPQTCLCFGSQTSSPLEQEHNTQAILIQFERGWEDCNRRFFVSSNAREQEHNTKPILVPSTGRGGLETSHIRQKQRRQKKRKAKESKAAHTLTQWRSATNGDHTMDAYILTQIHISPRGVHSARTPSIDG